MAKQILKDLINMDYESLINLSKKENINMFKSVLEHMLKASNRRINTLLKSDVGRFSPALKSLEDAGIKKFDVSFVRNATSKDTGKLLNLFSKSRQFLQAKSSRLQGWNKIRSQVKNRLGAKKLFGTEYKSKRQATYWINREKKFWGLYNKLVDEFGGIITELDSKRIQKMLYKIQSMKIKGKTDEFIQGAMEQYIDNLYQAKQKNIKFRDEDFEEELRIKFR